MKKIDQLFSEYSESHQNPVNKSIHWVCIPLIFFSILGFISRIPAPHLCLILFGCISLASIVAIVLITLFYLRLSFKIGLIILVIMLIFESVIYYININLPKSWMLYLGLFIISWIGQFYGHKIEGKKPSFLKDLQFLLIGPAWLISLLLK